MFAHQPLINNIATAFKEIYQYHPEQISLQFTKKEFNGDYTITLFQYSKQISQKPEEIGHSIGKFLIQKYPEVFSNYEVVKGFLNLTVTHQYLLSLYQKVNEKWGMAAPNSTNTEIMIEYSSPNTNKPLHLGHIRNNLLGWSMSEILKSQGHKVIKANLINDRGIHICKSMLAWIKWGNGETPESSGIKGDHLIGKYYVLFDKEYKKQVEELIKQGMSKEEAEDNAPLMKEAQQMLRDWEAGNPEVRKIWEMMNNWVYDGFNITYKRMGVDFDRIYYESQTYLLGKEIIQEGLQKGIFYKASDGSVRIDLSNEGLDEKVLLRSDGTSVYITQDIGTAVLRFKEYPNLNRLVYVVGSEQDYHFKVLFKILEKLGYPQAKECYHLSYGMVELPTGKMKSREGTVVDADDLMDEMFITAKKITEELGKVSELSEQEKNELYEIIGMGALKYFILKVDPKKKILFNPQESIDFEGHTAPFIQYVYARIQSLLRKANYNIQSFDLSIQLHKEERELIKHLLNIPDVYAEAAKQYNPAIIANDVYELAKKFNRFYQECPILSEANENLKNFRLHLSYTTAVIIKQMLKILGIAVPSRM
ncbi:MAG TPA: arginine--tRNA ligase [Bacteroidia bacterium]|nr:arginine--tRNA ligase [Bacteroidia bacterium]